LKELNPNIRCISLQPDSPFHGIEGTKHLGSTLVRAFTMHRSPTRILEFAPKTPTTWRGAWRAKKACWWAFPLAAAIVGCVKVADGLKKQQAAVIVTILADSGDKYLSERFWNEGEVGG